MGVLKQFIYTNTKSGNGVWGQSAAFPQSVMRYKNEFYTAYNAAEIEKQFARLEDVDLEEVFPVKRKYSVLGDKCLLLSENYIGKGLQTARYGNRFAHIFTADGLPENEPVSYFLRKDFFKTELNGEEKLLPKSLKYLDDIDDDGYFCTEISDGIADFIDSADKVEALAALLERALYVAQSDTAHMVFVNCGNGKLLWSWINGIIGLLPLELSKKFTFDTFFTFNRSVEWFRMRDKLIGFYANEKFDLCKERGHEYFVYDLSQPIASFAGEATERFKKLVSDIFGADGSSKAGVKIYRSFINKTQGADALDKMCRCAEFASATAVKFEKFPIKEVCTALDAGIYGENGDVLPVLRGIVNFACGAGVDELRAVLATFNKYQPLKEKLKQAAEEAVTAEAFVIAAADRVLSNDKIILNFIAELERYLKPSITFEKALSEEINRRISAEAEEIAEGLLNGAEGSIGRYDFIGNYSPDTQITIRKHIDRLFEENGKSITEKVFESGDDSVLEAALRFGYDLNEAVINSVSQYVEEHADKLAESLAAGDAKSIFSVKKLAEAYCDGAGALLADGLKKYYSDDAALNKLADGLLDGKAQAEEIFNAAREIYPDISSLVADRTDGVFLSEKADLSARITGGETVSAAAKLALFEKYGGKADVNAFLLDVCEKNFAGAADWNSVLDRDENKLAALKYLAENDVCGKFVSKSFTDFLTSDDFLNGNYTINGALEILRGCGLASIADEQAVFNNIIAAGAVDNAGALGFVTGYIEKMPENKHREFCNADKKTYSALFAAAVRNAVAENAETDNLCKVCGVFRFMGGKAQAAIIAKSVEEGKIPQEAFCGLLIKILPCANFAETLDYFIRKSRSAAEYYIDLYLKRVLTESAVVAVISCCKEDAAEIVKPRTDLIWKCLSANGTASAAEAFSKLIEFSQTASINVKQILLRAFILTYGVNFFNAAEVKRLSSAYGDCKGGYYAAVCAYGDLIQGNVVANRDTLAVLENKDGKAWVAFRTAIADLIADGKLNPKCFGCVTGIFGKELVNSVMGRFGRYSLGKPNEKHALGFIESFKKSNGGAACLHAYALDFVTNKNILDALKINCGKTDAQKELKRFTEYLTYSGRDDIERLNAFCDYIKVISVCDDGLAQTIIYGLDLRNIQPKNLARLIDGLESVQFDALKYLSHLRALRSVLNGKTVSTEDFEKHGCADLKLSGYFARIFAHLTARGNVSAQTAEVLLGIYGEEYAEDFADELTRFTGWQKNKAVCKAYEAVCGKCAFVKQKTDNFTKYAEENEDFRRQTERIFAGD